VLSSAASITVKADNSSAIFSISAIIIFSLDSNC
jgi:hypothetical protein